MFNRFFSDLPPGRIGETNVIIARPILSDKSEDIFHDPGAMSIILDNACNLQGLKHAGMLTLDRFDSKPHWYEPCGGNLIFFRAREIQALNTDHENSLFHQRPNLVNDSNMALVCENRKCNAEFVLNLTREQTQSLIFHLMIKQMIPALQSCYYLNCGNKEEYDPLDSMDEKKLKLISELGLISLHTEILHGQMALRKNLDWFALGFMLTDKMKTLDSCDGFDQWLKLLFLQKMDQIRQVLDLNSAILRGPKKKY